MAYTYDIATSKNDSRSTNCLTVSHILFNVINLFLSVFLIAHIYSLTTDLFQYVIKVGVYELSTYITMLIAYYLFSFWVDKTNRVWVYRIGNLLTSTLVVITIFFGKNLADLIVLAGFLNGLSKAAYYASYNVLKQEMVSRKTMHSFAVIVMILTKVVNVVCPILLGMLIDVSTYSMVAIYVFILSVILIVLTFFIKSKRPNESGFSVKEYIAKLKDNHDFKVKMKSIYKICLIYGFSSIVGSLLSVNIMLHFGSNLSLGLLTGICSFIAVCVLLLVNKFTKFGKRSWLFLLSSILLSITVLIFAVLPNMITLIIYHVVVTSVDIVVATIFDIIRNKNLKEAGFYQEIAEHQCITETMFQIARIISCLVLIPLSLFNNFIVFQVLFVVFNLVSYATMSIMLAKYEKTYGQQQSNLEIEKQG